MSDILPVCSTQPLFGTERDVSGEIPPRMVHVNENMAPTNVPGNSCFPTQPKSRAPKILNPNANDLLHLCNIPFWIRWLWADPPGRQAAYFLLPETCTKWIICHFSFPKHMPFYFILGVEITPYIWFSVVPGEFHDRCFLGVVSRKDACWPPPSVLLPPCLVFL